MVSIAEKLVAARNRVASLEGRHAAAVHDHKELERGSAQGDVGAAQDRVKAVVEEQRILNVEIATLEKQVAEGESELAQHAEKRDQEIRDIYSSVAEHVRAVVEAKGRLDALESKFHKLRQLQHASGHRQVGLPSHNQFYVQLQGAIAACEAVIKGAAK